MFYCRCVDYLRVLRGAGSGFTESCGTEVGDNREQLDEGEIKNQAER